MHALWYDAYIQGGVLVYLNAHVYNLIATINNDINHNSPQQQL